MKTEFDNPNYGGKRDGSGRKPSGRKKVQLWISPDEELYLREQLDDYRLKNYVPTTPD